MCRANLALAMPKLPGQQTVLVISEVRDDILTSTEGGCPWYEVCSQ
jgi:hypothetical protein